MKTAIVGGGLAGLAAAVQLAGRGQQVTLFEQNAHLGGKMNVWKSKGYTFDMGPTIITMPDVLQRLFSSVDRRVENYIQMISLDPQWRAIFADGSKFDLYSSLEGMATEMARFAPQEMSNYLRFLAYAHRMYDISDKWFFWKPYGSLQDVMKESAFLSPQSLALASSLDPMTSMHQAIRKHFNDPRLAQLFEHFVQYVGSSPFLAPAILSLIPYVQIALGCWYPMGGTGAIAAGLTKLCDEFGVEVRLNTPIERIEVREGRVRGVVANSQLHHADVVIANSDIVRTFTDLIPGEESETFLRRNEGRLEPACSGVVLYLGCRKRFTSLAHHSFLFSADSDAEFRDIYERRIPHPDPTIYLALPSLTDPTVAPPGCEAVYALAHTPYIASEYDWNHYADAYREILIDKMERCGMTGLRDSIETERRITPLDLERLYSVNKGAIYGVVTRRGLTSAFKTGNRSAHIQGLYFAGGSVNPGAGVPMALMSGQVAAACVLEDAGVRVEREPALAHTK